MAFRKYEKIHRLGKDEVDGILDGTVTVQEKIDGANTSIWLEEGGIKLGSRNRGIEDGFNGFADYVNSHEGIKEFFNKYPEYILYGEWLVSHTIAYKDTSYKQWYMFDIYSPKTNYWKHYNVKGIATTFEILTPHEFGTFENPIEEQLKEFVGQSVLGPKGEGIVIKNPEFINKYGNNCHAKIVRQEFMEDNALVFGGNNKHSETYNEMFIVNKWMVPSRVEKVCNKLQPEINEKLDLKHIPRITNTCYHDLITEEAWEIAKLNDKIDYKRLKGLALKKAKLIYMQHLGV